MIQWGMVGYFESEPLTGMEIALAFSLLGIALVALFAWLRAKDGGEAAK